MSATTTIASPEVLAAQDVRVLDLIENHLMELKGNYFNVDMIDDLVLGIQEYLKDSTKTNERALKLIADNAKLQKVGTIVQQIRNSNAFLALVAENTPEEIPIKPQIVATGTTAQAVAEQSQAKAESVTREQGTVTSKKPAKAPKTPKSKQVRPMPTIASLEALEAMDRKALIAAMGAINDNHKTGVRANGASLDIKVAIAKYVLNTTYVAPQKPAKAPKASSKKPKKQEPILELPEGLSWDEVKNMKYRQLQQLGKIFRSQGHEMPRLNSKGDDIRKAIANAMRSQGHNITEVAITSQGPAKDLHLPNWGAVKEQKRLERVATEALRMDATDAKVHMELAVAA